MVTCQVAHSVFGINRARRSLRSPNPYLTAIYSTFTAATTCDRCCDSR